MNNPKPLLVLWSKAAVDAAGPNLATLNGKLVTDATDIVSEAHDWFHHALQGEEEDTCFVGTGHELPDTWEIFVQIGVYKPLEPLPDDHPDPDRRGKVFKMAEVVDEPDNQIFAEFDDI